MAGIAAKSSTFPTGAQFTRTFRGVAPGANQIDLRVLDANGMSSDSVVIAAIERAVNLKSKYNIRVMNLSIGRPIYESYKLDPICTGVTATWKQGIVVVVAAGNLGRNGYATIPSPGNDPFAITVGAMKTNSTLQTRDDHQLRFESRSRQSRAVTARARPTLEVAYPQNIVPASDYVLPAVSTYPAYFELSGTSMATPVVSGAAAILIANEPTLGPDKVKARLMKTTSKTFPVTSAVTDPSTGAVYVDTYNMLLSAQVI